MCWVLGGVQSAVVRSSYFIRRARIGLRLLSRVGIDRCCFLGCNFLSCRPILSRNCNAGSPVLLGRPSLNFLPRCFLIAGLNCTYSPSPPGRLQPTPPSLGKPSFTVLLVNVHPCHRFAVRGLLLGTQVIWLFYSSS